MGHRPQQPWPRRVQWHELLPGYRALPNQHLCLSPSFPVPMTIDPRVLSLSTDPTANPSHGRISSSSSSSVPVPPREPYSAVGSCTTLPGSTIADALRTTCQLSQVDAPRGSVLQSYADIDNRAAQEGEDESTDTDAGQRAGQYGNSTTVDPNEEAPHIRPPLQELSTNIAPSRSNKNKTLYTRRSRTLQVIAIYTDITDTFETYM